MNTSKRKREDYLDDDLHNEEIEFLREEIASLIAEITALNNSIQKLTNDNENLMPTILQSGDKDHSKDWLRQCHADNRTSILEKEKQITAKENLITAKANLILEKEKQITQSRKARLADQLHAASQEGRKS